MPSLLEPSVHEDEEAIFRNATAVPDYALTSGADAQKGDSSPKYALERLPPEPDSEVAPEPTPFPASSLHSFVPRHPVSPPQRLASLVPETHSPILVSAMPPPEAVGPSREDMRMPLQRPRVSWAPVLPTSPPVQTADAPPAEQQMQPRPNTATRARQVTVESNRTVPQRAMPVLGPPRQPQFLAAALQQLPEAGLIETQATRPSFPSEPRAAMQNLVARLGGVAGGVGGPTSMPTQRDPRRVSSHAPSAFTHFHAQLPSRRLEFDRQTAASCSATKCAVAPSAEPLVADRVEDGGAVVQLLTEADAVALERERPDELAELVAAGVLTREGASTLSGPLLAGSGGSGGIHSDASQSASLAGMDITAGTGSGSGESHTAHTSTLRRLAEAMDAVPIAPGPSHLSSRADTGKSLSESQVRDTEKQLTESQEKADVLLPAREDLGHPRQPQLPQRRRPNSPSRALDFRSDDVAFRGLVPVEEPLPPPVQKVCATRVAFPIIRALAPSEQIKRRVDEKYLRHLEPTPSSADTSVLSLLALILTHFICLSMQELPRVALPLMDLDSFLSICPALPLPELCAGD